jgi:Flp pilus assembly protein TadB
MGTPGALSRAPRPAQTPKWRAPVALSAIRADFFGWENLADRVEDRSRTCDDGVVPLSEEEQRILRQIEQQLEQDPTFSQRGYRVSRRRSILLTVGLVLGLVVTIGGLAVNFLVSFVGFVIVLVMAIMLESELRLLGRERLGQLPISAWLSGRRPDVDDDATR